MFVSVWVHVARSYEARLQNAQLFYQAVLLRTPGWTQSTKSKLWLWFCRRLGIPVASGALQANRGTARVATFACISLSSHPFNNKQILRLSFYHLFSSLPTFRGSSYLLPSPFAFTSSLWRCLTRTSPRLSLNPTTCWNFFCTFHVLQDKTRKLHTVGS